VIALHHATPEETYFWSVPAGAELDLMILRHGKRLGFEFKHTDAPTRTRSMAQAAELLSLDSLTVVYPGGRDIALGSHTRAVPLATLRRELAT
jgi:hypothetical protein